MDAAGQLTEAFRRRSATVPHAQPLIGVFGDGLPEAIVQASGGMPIEVKAPPLDGEGPTSDIVDRIAEPFLDDFARAFLHRFATGAFDTFAAIVFARDDAAGLVTYQYASELRRQGRVPKDRPRLHLWNLVHANSSAAHAFNISEAAKLAAFLSETLAIPADERRAAAALAAEGVRHRVVTHLEALGLDGATEFVWRNAGRWLAPDRHAQLLDAALADAVPTNSASRIGLVGTACDLPILHQVAGKFGQVVADLQPYGKVWPRCHAGPSNLADLLKRVATEPIHIRINPPNRYGEALLAELQDCDVVIASYDTNDDSFGWEVPRLRKALSAQNIPLVDLGFRPFRPNTEWCDRAAEKIAEVLP